MKPLKGEFDGFLDPSLIPFVIKRIPRRTEYTGNYREDSILMTKIRKDLVDTFSFDKSAEEEFSKMRAAYFCTYYDLEGDANTFSDTRYQINVPEQVYNIMNDILCAGYRNLMKQNIKDIFRYDIRPPANTGYPWYMSGKQVHGVRLLNYLLGELSSNSESGIIRFSDELQNKSSIPNLILFNSRLQDAGPNKITPILRGDSVVVPQDTFLSKRNRAINLASKVSYAVAMQPIKLIQKTLYSTPLSSNDQHQINQDIINFTSIYEDEGLFSDYSKFDYHMAGPINDIVNLIKKNFISSVKPEWSSRLDYYLNFHAEKIRYIYPYFGYFVQMKTKHHFGSGRRDTSVHGTLANMTMFVHFLFSLVGSEEEVKKIVYDTNNYFKCFSDDMVWFPSNHIKNKFGGFEEIKDKFYSFIKATYNIEAKDEKPKKYLGVIYDKQLDSFGGVDPYAIIRKSFSPERRKIPLLQSIGVLARRLMLRDIFGNSEGDILTNKIVKRLEEIGIFGYSTMEKKLTFQKIEIDPVVMSEDPMEAMITLSKKASSYDLLASEYNEVLFLIAQVRGKELESEEDEFFPSMEDNTYSVEETREQLKKYTHLAVSQILDNSKDMYYNTNITSAKNLVDQIIKRPESDLAYQILKMFIPQTR